MELRRVLQALLRRWWLVLAPVVVVVAYVALTYRPPAVSYQVVMRYAAGTEPAGLSEDYDRYYPWLTSEYVANGLADVAETRTFATAVAARLAEHGIAVDPGGLQAGIVTDNAQSILVVYLTWPDPAQIESVAQAMTEELEQGGPAYFPQLEGVGPAVRLLDEPQPFPLIPGLRAQLLGPAVRVGLALAVGAGLALAYHYLDPSVREAHELEEMGLEVVGRIPRHRKGT